MKAATLLAPWAWAVAHGSKDVENRKTRCPSILDRRIAIHAGVAPRTAADIKRQEDDFLWIWQHAGILPGTGSMGPDYGCIVAVATVIGWVDGAKRTLTHGSLHASEAVFHAGIDSRWFQGPFGWLLHDRRALPEPIPARGRQGLWDVHPEIEAEIMRQMTSNMESGR